MAIIAAKGKTDRKHIARKRTQKKTTKSIYFRILIIIQHLVELVLKLNQEVSNSVKILMNHNV